MARTISNLVVNLNKVRAANIANRPAEASVVVFDYFAPENESGELNQTPLVRVISNSLVQTSDGDWMFRGVNLYRIGEDGKADDAIRSFKLSRINGLVRRPA